MNMLQKVNDKLKSRIIPKLGRVRAVTFVVCILSGQNVAADDTTLIAIQVILSPNLSTILLRLFDSIDAYCLPYSVFII